MVSTGLRSDSMKEKDYVNFGDVCRIRLEQFRTAIPIWFTVCESGF